MSNKFKQQAATQRAAVPQIDLEASPLRASEPVPESRSAVPQSEVPKLAPTPTEPTSTAESSINLTPVDTSERPVSHGFQMYPSRHRQLAKDLAYIEDRNPWLIIDDALEEYVLRHYGREHKRR
jgi:hypothetical protein